jgi:hypothetical protein
MLSPDVTVAEAAIVTVSTFFSGFAAQAIDRANDRALDYIRSLEEDLRAALPYTRPGHERYLRATIPAITERMGVQPLERFVRTANTVAFVIMLLLAIAGGVDAGWHFSIHISIGFWVLASLLTIDLIILTASSVHANTSRADLQTSVERLAPRMFSIVGVLRLAPSNLGSVLVGLENSPPGTARFWLGISLVSGGFYSDAPQLLESGREAGISTVEANIGQFALARAYEELGRLQEERAELVERLMEGVSIYPPKSFMEATWPADWGLWVEAAREAENRKHGVLDFGISAAFVRRFIDNIPAREAYATMCESFNNKHTADFVRHYKG